MGKNKKQYREYDIQAKNVFSSKNDLGHHLNRVTISLLILNESHKHHFYIAPPSGSRPVLTQVTLLNEVLSSVM